MNKAFGVQVTIPDKNGGRAVVQPLVVVAESEDEAETLAANTIKGDAETIRELTADEVEEYGLDLDRHGDVKALPALNL